MQQRITKLKSSLLNSVTVTSGNTILTGNCLQRKTKLFTDKKEQSSNREHKHLCSYKQFLCTAQFMKEERVKQGNRQRQQKTEHRKNCW